MAGSDNAVAGTAVAVFSASETVVLTDHADPGLAKPRAAVAIVRAAITVVYAGALIATIARLAYGAGAAGITAPPAIVVCAKTRAWAAERAVRHAEHALPAGAFAAVDGTAAITNRAQLGTARVSVGDTGAVAAIHGTAVVIDGAFLAELAIAPTAVIAELRGWAIAAAIKRATAPICEFAWA